MDLLYKVFIDPFVQMVTAPDLLIQTLWEGLVGGVLYALIALGFVLIFKASGVFNFAQGIMVVFAALTLVGLTNSGVPRGVSVLVILAGLALAGWWLYRFLAARRAEAPGSAGDHQWRWLVGVGIALFGVAAFFMFERQMPAFIALAVTMG